ncbi:MAG TPA: hypothetical protein VKF36_06330 [Syntrophorhabdales bacterium]|nr:hypothetical protein [Syntrophorhabdales bacterium]
MAKNTMNAVIVLVLAVGLVLAVLSPSGAAQQQTQPAPCMYAFEWIHTFRFPLQADPRCAYSYVLIPQLSQGIPVGFVVDAEFPYAAWFSWTIYGVKAQAVSLASDRTIVPDGGSTNPFVDGNPVFAPHRHYRLLLLPADIPPGTTIAPSLADIQNVLMISFDQSMTAIAYRVYQAFPGYNLGGSGGRTNTPFPSVYAVNYETGEKLDCATYDAVPPTIGHLPTDTPDVENIYGTTPDNMSRGQDLWALEDSIRLLGIPEFAALQSKAGWQFAPQIDPALVTFTRPPLAPGADVSSMPPPDQCAGYLGARVDPLRIALIRLPHIASVFETELLKPHTTFPGDSQAAYISLTMYGASVNTYEPNHPDSASLANAEFRLDKAGGSTIVVWPRHLPVHERMRLFAYAHAHGWALIQGGSVGPLTTANLLLRLKRANDDYYGAYTPLPPPHKRGVPCYFNGLPQGTRWSEIENVTDPTPYVASFQNLGNAAPQGVHCADVEEVLNGSCLKRLEAYIEKNGGKYFNPGYAPPPGW